MTLGILPDRHLDHVPGTSFLDERGASNGIEGGEGHVALKHDPSGTIVLVPQPSDSPNDPLNWPAWKKNMFTVAIAFGSGCVGACGPLLSSAVVPLAEELDVSLQHFTLGFQGSCIAALGLGSLLCNSLAVMVGKRPVYLATTVGLIVTCIWSAETTSFTSLAISRAVQGFCMAPMEALVPASIADIFYVHERGFRNAIFNLGVLGGINLASPIAGAVIDNSSYRTCLYGMVGAFIVQLLLTFFFMPESHFDRSVLPGSSVTSTAGEDSGPDEKKLASDKVSSGSVRPATAEKAHTFLYDLRPWSGYYDSSNFLKNLVSPFFMLASPIVVWGAMMFNICISWLVLLTITLSQIFSGPPYNFSVTSVGLTSLSSFIATLIATGFSGLAVDGLVKLMSRHNNGIYEPEFRLPIISLYLLLTGSGFFAWGQSLYNVDPWPIPVIVCMGIINLGVQFGTTGVVTYVVDCHRERAAEAFAIMSFVKSMFSFGMTFYCNDWIAVQGVRNTFFVVGGITVAITLTTIPMYIYGKRARSFAFRSGLMGSSS
ncbi:major facilitator superfamily domain-containing protein [Plectosphaerella plurivora]|uniref:Major facilitator superfamily domain-containing protein n=1 Tax=Plectosphaerella plurivora TaxID=936078 RepID=A0A9P8VIW3_9PEZI|nr:major facilitator superfamily domain-containing protein [Plectosphaerella plurivora]